MASRCKKCEVGEPVMCRACVDELVDRCLLRVAKLQSEIGKMHAMLKLQQVQIEDPATDSHDKDDG